jgi:hypothetical protein
MAWLRSHIAERRSTSPPRWYRTRVTTCPLIGGPLVSWSMRCLLV